MFYVPVGVIAAFNEQGKIRPNFVRIEDENHTLRTYKIEDIISSREERYAGIPVLRFCCNIVLGDCTQMINIKYHINTHQWVLIYKNDSKGESTDE